MYGFHMTSFSECSKILFSYGIRAYGIDVIGTLFKNINQILITTLFSPFYLGIYIVSTSISNMLNIFQNSVVEVLFPSTAGKEKALVVNIAARSARCSNYFTLIVALVLILTAPNLIKVLYGDDFLRATNVLRILILSILVSSSDWILSQTFLSLNKPGIVTLLQSFGIIVTIPMFILFINFYGINGAALAILFSNLIRLISTLICYKLVLKVKIPNVIFDPEDIRFIRSKIINLKSKEAIR
jgi:O-antigen/teichoic acid export membrane protein